MSGSKKPGATDVALYSRMDEGTNALQYSPAPHPTGVSATDYNLLDLETSLASLKSQAVNFGERFIKDSAVRASYMRQTEFVAKTLLEEVQLGRLSPFEAAEEANKIRNAIMEAERVNSSDIGRAEAQALKSTGKSLKELESHYAQKLFKSTFERLTQANKNKVWREIVEASGRPRPVLNVKAMRLAKAGRGLIFFSVAFSVYNVATAENMERQVVKEGATAGVGLLGGMAGGAVAGLACGPGAPVCVAVGVFVGGAAAALGTDFAFDRLW